jgi:hypothetical protein
MKTSTQSIPNLTPESITITVQKTVQVPKFEPVMISITETYNIPPGVETDTVRKVLTKSIGSSVAGAINKEVSRYEPQDDEE